MAKKISFPKSKALRLLERKETRGEFKYLVKVSFTRERKHSGAGRTATYGTLKDGTRRTSITHQDVVIQRRMKVVRTRAEAKAFYDGEKKRFLKSKWQTADGAMQLVTGRLVGGKGKYRGKLVKTAQASPMARTFSVSKLDSKGRRRKKSLVNDQLSNKFRALLNEPTRLMLQLYSIEDARKRKDKERKGKKVTPTKAPPPERASKRAKVFAMNAAKRAAEERALMASFRKAEKLKVKRKGKR